jgi:glyceraldehyde 3-phosphate dehydrogenase
MIKIGINGFGRMGRLAIRALFEHEELKLIQINDPAGSVETMAHLVNFDSIHGIWNFQAYGDKNDDGYEVMRVGEDIIGYSRNSQINQTDWSECDIVIEASGKMKTKALLQSYLDQGVKRVVVTAPVKEEGIANIVMGVNQEIYDPKIHPIVTAASCTTNCLAPVVKVLHQSIGIKHGSMTTIHDITNTQSILDTPHKDLRRARACGTNLIPTTTGSATAITHIFPELKGKLNGHAVRVPIANASLTDCVFEMNRPTNVEEINQLLKQAAENELKDILGFEERPLVSVDYKTDPRSSVVDALSTMVINDTQVKLYLWYDNEWGYINRTIELVKLVSDLDN